MQGLAFCVDMKMNLIVAEVQESTKLWGRY